MEAVANKRSQVLSDESSEESEEDSPPPAKKSRRQFEWERTNSFQTLAEAKSFVKAADTWKLRRHINQMDGVKSYYDCRHGRDCSAKLHLFRKVPNNDVDIYITTDPHDHIIRQCQGLNLEVKNKIDDLYKSGLMKPKLLLNALKKHGLEPRLGQIASYVRYNIRRKEGHPVVSLGEMEKLCIEGSNLPECLDTPYICDHEVNYDEKSFKVVLGTRRLLESVNKSDSIQADATYKLLWQGYPVIMLGTSDKQRKFHPFCVAITSSETHEDYSFCFNSLKKFHDIGYSPKVLIADCADSITNGFKDSFGTDFLRVYCWAHIYRNLSHNKHLIKLAGPQQTDLLADISQVQLCQSENEFNAALKLLLKKWIPVAPDFCEYFRLEYVQKNSGWYEGYAPGYPKTNNGLESTNKVLKTNGTFHERLAFGVLISALSNVLKSWSEERNPDAVNHKDFSDNPLFSLKLQTTAFQWSQTAEIKYRTSEDGQTRYYFVPATGTPKLKDSDINNYIRMSTHTTWKTFDGYKRGITRLWKVEMNCTQWDKSTCTCKTFQKQYICKHILGIAIKRRLFEVVPEAKNVPLGEKRKRGRPQKAKKALIVQ